MAAKSTPLQKARNGKLVSKRSRTNDPQCSAAASAFAKLRSGGTAPPDLFSTLAKCRAKARNNQQAKLQREAGNEAKAQVLEKRAERGMTGKDRLARARELVAQRAAAKATASPARPSLREQVQAARKAKGADHPYVRAVRAQEARQERASFHEGRKAAEAAPNRFKDSAARKAYLAQGNTAKAAAATITSKPKDQDWMAARGLKAYRSGVESGLRRAAKAAPARPSTLEQARTARAAKGDRTARLKALAERSMAMAESRATKANSLSGAAQDRMLDRSMAAAGRYNRLEAARTPYKPATAIKPAETPRPSLREQAAAHRASKGPAGARAGRLAAVAKKRSQSASKVAEKSMAKAMTAMSTGGTAFALSAARKATAKADVNSKRLERLAARFAGMKTVSARVVDTPKHPTTMSGMSKPTVNKPDKGTRGDRLYAVMDRINQRVQAQPRTNGASTPTANKLFRRGSNVGQALRSTPLEKPERSALAAQVKAARAAARNPPEIKAASERQAQFAADTRAKEVNLVDQYLHKLRFGGSEYRKDREAYRKRRIDAVLERGAIAAMSDARQILDNRGRLGELARVKIRKAATQNARRFAARP